MQLRRILWVGPLLAAIVSCGDSMSGPGASASSAGQSGSATSGRPSTASGSAGAAGGGPAASGEAGSAGLGGGISDAATADARSPNQSTPDGGDASAPMGPTGDASASGDSSPGGSDASIGSDSSSVVLDAGRPGDDASAAGGDGAVQDAGGGGSAGSLHVGGSVLLDGNGKQVVLRGPELVIRWGVYSGLTSAGVDVPWEGGSNNNVGSPTVREIGKTKANAIRIYGGIGNELDGILNTAIVEQKMFVGVGRVDWANAQMKATLDKYGKYLFIHPRGEFTYRDANQWRTESLTVVKYIRGLGYKQAIEIGTTGYGQTWSTIQMYGQEVAASDPLKNTFFLLQLYSELAQVIPQTLVQIAAFPYPVTVDACLFTSTYGNTPDTYKQVWDQSFAKNFSSFYWDWWGDGTGASMTTSGTFASLDAIGHYIANDSPAALKNTVKTDFLLNSAVP